jgi:site-specific recombinase XerD
MLAPYRRHSPDCKHAGKGAGYTACKCAIWCYGQTDDGRTIRQSLRTRDWNRANRRLEQLAATPAAAAATILTGAAGARVLPGDAMAIRAALDLYLADCERRRLAASTLLSYRKTFEPFLRHCHANGVDYMSQLNLSTFGAFHTSRGGTAKSQRKEIEHLRGFCAFAVLYDWISKNYAKAVKPPRDTDPMTLPFERGEVAAMLAAVDQLYRDRGAGRRAARPYGGDHRGEDDLALERSYARALLLLLLYSGLRISDALTLRRHQLNAQTGDLFLRTMKTGFPLYLQLHRTAIDALLALPVNGACFFWYQDGGCVLESAIEHARRTVARVAALAGVRNAHPHRFRDTFARELLTHGATMRTVQLLLGHDSIKTTEKHYAGFMPDHQNALNRATATLNFAVP